MNPKQRILITNELTEMKSDIKKLTASDERSLTEKQNTEIKIKQEQYNNNNS